MPKQYSYLRRFATCMLGLALLQPVLLPTAQAQYAVPPVTYAPAYPGTIPGMEAYGTPGQPASPYGYAATIPGFSGVPFTQIPGMPTLPYGYPPAGQTTYPPGTSYTPAAPVYASPPAVQPYPQATTSPVQTYQPATTPVPVQQTPPPATPQVYQPVAAPQPVQAPPPAAVPQAYPPVATPQPVQVPPPAAVPQAYQPVAMPEAPPPDALTSSSSSIPPQSPPSPFTTPDAASFGPPPPVGPVPMTMSPYIPPPAVPTSPYPTATNMMAWTPAPLVAGIKHTYQSEYGDYFNLQPRNAGRWIQFPITVHLTFPEGMTEADKTTVRSAVTAWQSVIDLMLVEQPEQARIRVVWVSHLDNDADLGMTEFPQTQPDSYGRTAIYQATIKMLDPRLYSGVKPGVLKAAMMHQLGHALGIQSHSDNDRDVMGEPSYKTVSNQMMQKAFRSLAVRTIGQFIDIPSLRSTPPPTQPKGPPVDKLTKRDLNTLYRLYQPTMY